MSADVLRADQIAKAPKLMTSTSNKLLWAGRLVASKRPDISIWALSRLIARENEAHLEIAGTGPEMERLRSLANHLGVENHITWLGWVKAAAMAEIYRRNDVLLYTSVRDSGFPSALEAAAQGTPAIGFRHQGFGANYSVNFDCFVEGSPGARSSELGDVFADAVVKLLASDYAMASAQSIALAGRHNFLGRAAELLQDVERVSMTGRGQ
ncbi:glycosyltransferase family 4 protein [uncultured Arthrobacter sp.]|uniref:glycosyltransferase family 4 protein n=1 Tax=uncultured Arthrobacter sp. TaxID=114050 RepID=UPI00260F371D|nr:glycosyltransferase family 4 protein [uncultured Arthrobacter sp.]